MPFDIMSWFQRLRRKISGVPLVVRYGAVLSAGIVVLKTLEYQLFSFRYRHDIYSGLLALFFLLFGLLIGFLVLGKQAENGGGATKRIEPLTAAERRVLAGLINGQTNQQLADDNNVTLNTIKTHLKNLYKKLNVRNRNQAVDVAKEQSLL